MKNKSLLELLPQELCVCRLSKIDSAVTDKKFCFFARTDNELSLVCPSDALPDGITEKEGGWRAFRFSGKLDFSLVGVLYGVSKILAEEKIGIFVVSTFDTDYILIKKENLTRAISALEKGGYELSYMKTL